MTSGVHIYWSNAQYVSFTAVLLFISLAVGVYSMFELYYTFTTHSKLYEKAEFTIFPAKGKSMYPKIKNGDLVVVYRTNDKAMLKTGEILFLRVPMKYSPYFKEGRFVAHRLMNVDGNNLLTKGDNESKPDRKIPIWYCEGIVVAKIEAIVGDTILFEKLTSDESLFQCVQSKHGEILANIKNIESLSVAFSNRSIYHIIITILVAAFVTSLAFVL